MHGLFSGVLHHSFLQPGGLQQSGDRDCGPVRQLAWYTPGLCQLREFLLAAIISIGGGKYTMVSIHQLDQDFSVEIRAASAVGSDCIGDPILVICVNADGFLAVHFLLPQ